MSNNIRMIAIFILNIALTIAMLAWQKHSGIDINNTTLIENAHDLRFAFDFIAFMIASLTLNIVLLSIPSKRKIIILKAIKKLSESGAIKNIKSDKKQIA
jgi:uncharacterized membrane protein (DUF4010 family)